MLQSFDRGARRPPNERGSHTPDVPPNTIDAVTAHHDNDDQSFLKGLALSPAFARALLLAVIVLAACFVAETWAIEASAIDRGLYILFGLLLCFGALCHVLLHLGYALRRRDAIAERLSEEDLARGRRTPCGFLIPSYKEEPEYVFRALLSSALQRNEDKWVRLLVDDPPDASGEADRRLLDAARALPGRVEDFLAPFAAFVRAANLRVEFERQQAPHILARLHSDLGKQFECAAETWLGTSPEDKFFVQEVLMGLASAHRNEAIAASTKPDSARADIQALARRFEVTVEAFERKRYENLAHAANKAMNLNVAIGLIGQHLEETVNDDRLHLVALASGREIFPAVDFVATLDADSLLSPFYAETLLARATLPGMERAAVVQTPYATTPEPASFLERVAGATTDVQRILHQGFSRWDAAFWVGANAVLRLEGLNAIAQDDEERGWPIRRFIQDRTPIEDTESTVDLAVAGWRVINHDDVLAPSATPPDFGALAIQRRRWACGGLVVLPKAIRAARGGGLGLYKASQLVMRVHYLGSLFWIPLALTLVAFNPLDDDLQSLFLPLAAVPYFVAYALDLRLAKRPVWEILPVHVLNISLVPVNLAGAFASIRQIATGRKVPFIRTPKVEGRTAAPAVTVALLWVASLAFAISSLWHVWIGDYGDATFAAASGVLILLSANIFIGARESREDIRVGLLERKRRSQDVWDERQAKVWGRQNRPPPAVSAGKTMRAGRR